MRHVLKGEEGGRKEGRKEGITLKFIQEKLLFICLLYGHTETVPMLILIYCTHIRVFDRQVHAKIIPRTVSQPLSKARICQTNVK